MIYVTGDTHGPVPFGYAGVDGVSRRLNMEAFPEQKEMTKDDYVIICGDFGCVWNYDSRYDSTKSAFKDYIALDHGESKEEKNWLDWLDHKPFTTLFCDGNHENYDRLESAYDEVDFHGGKAHRINIIMPSKALSLPSLVHSSYCPSVCKGSSCMLLSL